ncbi:MAG TPA: hypothetical protein VMA36_19690 [Candidatus Limnocylindria bacterium]|jgi:hypothetical protein|nr:hypothetical protein [Candidatus Limnocylindria bacterium]
MRASLALAAALALLCACARREPEHVPPPSPTPTVLPTPRSFPALRVGMRGIPRLNAMQLREIHAVLAASTPKERRNLIVSLLDGTPSGAMELFYGDPRHPDGIVPGMVSAYHIIGAGCNLYYRPSTGEIFPSPPDGCAHWTPSPADRAILRVP